ncbi:hypothetical protein [Streptomyces sp. NPDC003006]
MCEHTEDLRRTLALLTALIRYVHRPGADEEFRAVVGPALAASLPPGLLPPGYDPTEGPHYPDQEW